jgi:hypothetical protein
VYYISSTATHNHTSSVPICNMVSSIRKADTLYLKKNEKYDEECLSKINEALEKINWTKYLT